MHFKPGGVSFRDSPIASHHRATKPLQLSVAGLNRLQAPLAPEAGAVFWCVGSLDLPFTACLPHTTYCPDCARLFRAHCKWNKLNPARASQPGRGIFAARVSKYTTRRPVSGSQQENPPA